MTTRKLFETTQFSYYKIKKNKTKASHYVNNNCINSDTNGKQMNQLKKRIAKVKYRD